MQFHCDCECRITTAVDAFSDHVVLNATWTNVTEVRDNIIFQVYLITSSEQDYGIIVNNATWHTNSTSTDVVVNIVDSPPPTARPLSISPSQSAMFLSRDALDSVHQTYGSLTWSTIMQQVECINVPLYI